MPRKCIEVLSGNILVKYVVLTEVGKEVGFGHFTRCEAIYKAIKEKNMVDLIVKSDVGLKQFFKNNLFKITYTEITSMRQKLFRYIKKTSTFKIFVKNIFFK